MTNWISNRVTTELPEAARSEVSSRGPQAPAPSRTPLPLFQVPRQRWVLMASVGVVLLVLAVWAIASRRGQQSAAGETAGEQTATVKRGDFVHTVRIHGVIEAVQSHTVAAPRLAGPGGGPMLITKLARAGSAVKKGELLVEFDRQNQIKTALDRRAEYLDLEEQIKKRRADHAAAEARDQTELKQAENALETARLELRRNEVVSRIDAEKNQQNFEEAEVRLKELRDTLNLKRVARQADLRIMEIQRDRSRNAMKHAEENSEKMAIRAPIAGLVVLNSIWKGGNMAEVQEGDEVRPGAVFMQVVNPTAMLVRTRVNQADFLNVRTGQPVRVRMDAYPELSFGGRVEQLAAVGVTSQRSQKVRGFAAVFAVQGSDPKLMPDLSASVDVEIERKPNVLLVPRDAVSTENGQTFVYARNGVGADKRAVKIGAVSDREAVIESGVDEGTVVLRGKG